MLATCSCVCRFFRFCGAADRSVGGPCWLLPWLSLGPLGRGSGDAVWFVSFVCFCCQSLGTSESFVTFISPPSFALARFLVTTLSVSAPPFATWATNSVLDHGMLLLGFLRAMVPGRPSATRWSLRPFSCLDCRISSKSHLAQVLLPGTRAPSRSPFCPPGGGLPPRNPAVRSVGWLCFGFPWRVLHPCGWFLEVFFWSLHSRFVICDIFSESVHHRSFDGGRPPCSRHEKRRSYLGLCLLNRCLTGVRKRMFNSAKQARKTEVEQGNWVHLCCGTCPRLRLAVGRSAGRVGVACARAGTVLGNANASTSPGTRRFISNENRQVCVSFFVA